MATSGSKSVSVTSWDTLKFSWAQVSQSVTNNTTTISWKMELISGSSGAINSSVSKDWSVTVNGSTYSGSNTIGIGNNATKTLASGSTTITHAADGTKSFAYSFSQEFGITFSGSSIGTKSGNGTGELNTIPRATQPTVSASSVDMGVAVTISTPRASSSFTHDLAYAFAGSGYTGIATGVATSYSWTVPDLASKIPNATSGTVTIRCITKSGSTTVGTKTVLLTAKVPSSVVPTISSVTLTEATSGIAAQFGAFVQSKSKVKTTIAAAGAKGSTITAYSATYQGKTYTASTWTSDIIKAAGSQSMTVKVKDSRGRWSATTTKTFTSLAYETPKITELKAYRVDANGAVADDGNRASVSYAYSVASVNGKNTAAMKLQFKRSTATSYADADVLATGTDLNGSGLRLFSTIFSPDYQYDLRMTVTDYFGAQAVYTAVLPSGAVILDLKADGTGVSFFKVCNRSGVEIDAELPGSSVYLTEGQDLNDLRTPGFYSIPSTAVSGTLLNKPYTSTATGNIIVLRDGNGVQRRQICRKGTKNDGTIYEREYYGTDWGAWEKVYDGKGTVLWSGGMTMVDSHTINLPEPISAQTSGIVLVFSRYSASTVQNYHYNHFFVHKAFVAANPGVGSHFMMTTDGTFSVVGGKYLYISDDKITGNDNNTATGTGTSGIIYNNGGFVLRYVLGV